MMYINGEKTFGDEIMEKYIKKVNLIMDKEDMKELVRIMFKDIDLDDIDFNDIIYDYVIPKLKIFGCDMSYVEETRTTNYEKVIREIY